MYKTLSWLVGRLACDFEVNVETAFGEQEREEVEPVSQWNRHEVILVWYCRKIFSTQRAQVRRTERLYRDSPVAGSSNVTVRVSSRRGT